MKQGSEKYELYKAHMQKVADLRFAGAVLQWDQETYLPPGAARFRGQQISTITELSHQMFTEEKFGALLDSLIEAPDITNEQKKNVQRTHEDYTRSKKYTPAFVRKLSEQVNKAFHAWIQARKQNDFKIYEPELATLVKLKREEAELLGYEGHPYNALLDEYEKGATVAMLDNMFSKLIPGLQQLLGDIGKKPQVNDDFLRRHYPKDQQWAWGMHLVKALHFNFEHGRQDISEHPFSVSFNPEDVRITTRISEDDIANMTWSCIHEVGHALYEQGLPVSEYGLPLGEACSYSIHESQSRLWENCVGRSEAFCRRFLPQMQEFFPKQLGQVSVQEFFRGINKVQPSLIRTEADEITYHFHVFIRYEIEKQLIAGELETAAIPASWNRMYKEHLGINVPDDRSGCLQDVHWSHGSFGYFPTYSLGSFYAAQFYAAAADKLGDLDVAIASGNKAGLLEWLRKQVHGKGRYYTSEELCREITGEGLNVDHFMLYLTNKFSKVYS